MSKAGYVERITEMQVEGWVLRKPGDQTKLSVLAGEKSYPLRPVWEVRADVANQYGFQWISSGFTCLLPSFAAPDLALDHWRNGKVRLTANGHPLALSDSLSPLWHRETLSAKRRRRFLSRDRRKTPNYCLQEVNARLHSGSSLIPAIKATVTSMRLSADEAPFLFSFLVPLLSRRTELANLARDLDLCALPSIFPLDSAAGASVQAACCAASQEIALAVERLEQLAAIPADTSWLNTECVGFAVREVFVQSSSRSEQLRALAAYERILEGLHNAHDPRLYDLELVRTSAHLLGNSNSIDLALAERCTVCALRFHGVSPAFWDLVSHQEKPFRSASLQAAEQAWGALQTASRPGSSFVSCEAIRGAIDFFEGFGNSDAGRLNLLLPEAASGPGGLSMLTPAEGLSRLSQVEIILIAPVRNEKVILPHFLEHYRQLGVEAFVFIDNDSDDGTREFLLSESDVVVYGTSTPYREADYGVRWQAAVADRHAIGKWTIFADADEFLVFPGCEETTLSDYLQQIEEAGYNAVCVEMVDMYPRGPLKRADFSTTPPFKAAPWFDVPATTPWHLGSGHFSNAMTRTSHLRHRLVPDASPDDFTGQKYALLRYQPWVKLSPGVHYAANIRPAPERIWFAHFKYHAGFAARVEEEVARGQHFDYAADYKRYSKMLRRREGRSFWSWRHSRKFKNSSSFVKHLSGRL